MIRSAVLRWLLWGGAFRGVGHCDAGLLDFVHDTRWLVQHDSDVVERRADACQVSGWRAEIGHRAVQLEAHQRDADYTRGVVVRYLSAANQKDAALVQRG